MTRSEAVRKLSTLPFGPSCGQEPWLIDALVSLGVLKLDEPKSVLRRAESALRVAIQVGSPEDPMDAVDIIGCLDDAGLKIVEK